MQINQIGKMIRFHRKKSGLNQEELAKLAGVGKTVVFDAEQGKQTIRLDTLVKILNVLNIQLSFNGPLIKQFEEIVDEEG